MIIKTNGTQKEAQVIHLTQKQNPLLHYNIEYDTAQPEATIRSFVGNIRDMISRYEYNKARIVEIEAELVDLLHWIEISSYKNVPEGYKLYRKLADLRRERRACKNENDLLWPIYEHFHATDVLTKLSLVQGECAKAKNAIDARTYMVRTDILNEYLEEPNKEETTVEIGGISTDTWFGKDLIKEAAP